MNYHSKPMQQRDVLISISFSKRSFDYNSFSALAVINDPFTVDIKYIIFLHLMYMRTTLDIDKPILDELRRLGKRRKKSLSRIASELLATSLKRETEKRKGESGKTFRWNARSMGARIDIENKDELYRVLNEMK